MYYLVYHINKMILYWREKSTLFMNENKRIDNPRIKIGKCVGVRAQQKKCVETIQNQEMGVSFNTQNSVLSNWSLPTEKIFQAHRQICLWQIFQLSIFVLAREKCHYQSHWIRNFMLKFSFCILVFFSFQENLNLLFWKRYQFSAAIIRKNFRQTTSNWEWWRLLGDITSRATSGEGK